MSNSYSEDFNTSLCELTSNKRPLIDMLTMLAEDYKESAPSIVQTVEKHLTHVIGEKLATLYLIDSICKNVGGDYIPLFAQNLPKLFTMVFSQADLRTRARMFKLRCTWNGTFPPDKLLLLDSFVYNIDPGWPVATPPQSTNIHVNPAFISGGMSRHPVVKDIVKERLLQEKKDLLELQKKKVELEILQTKKVLAKEQKKLEFTLDTTSRVKPNKEVKPPKAIPDANYVHTVEKVQPSSTKDPENEKNKKLLEISMRDPRRKSRQKDGAADSPLSGTSSPVPSKVKLAEPKSSSSSPRVDFSDDSRDCPPKKKHKNSKENESRVYKDSNKDKKTEKTYKPKSADGSKSNNGLSYKPSNINPDEYEDMETVENDILSSDSHDKISESTSTSKPERVETTLSSKSISEKCASPGAVVEKNKSPKGKKIADVDIRQSVESSLSEFFETGKPTIPVRRRDPRLTLDSSRSKGVTKSDSGDKSQPVTLVSQLPSDDSSENIKVSVSNLQTDLISDLSSLDSNDKNLDIQMTDSPSLESTTNFDISSEVRSIDSNALFEELKNSDDDSGSDISLKNTSKRKCAPEEDKESHKKILLHQTEKDSPTVKVQPDNITPEPVSSHVEPSEPKITLSTKSPLTPPLVPPPPPIISKLAPSTEDLSVPLLKTNESESTSTPVQDISTLVNTEETGKDVDLRLLLPRPIERPKEELKIEPTPDDDPLKLFGGEDVDYRQKPPQVLDINPPSPPPPPVISNLQKSPGKDSWAQIKDRKSEERLPSPKINKKLEDKFQSPKPKPEKPKRPSLSHSKSNVSSKEISRQSSQEHCNILIKEAEEQLRNGNITFVEYNKMLQEVVNINEERILKEARARFSNPYLEDESTPVSLDSESSNVEVLTDSLPDEFPKESDKSEPKSSKKSKESSKRKKRVKSSDSRVTEPSGVSSTRDSERERNEKLRNMRVWDNQSGPPSNTLENFGLPQALPRGVPMQQFPLFPPNIPFQQNFRPRMPSRNAQTFIPPVNMDLLIEAENNRTEKITIGGSTKPIRFYGFTAVVLQSWDDPREVCFPPEKRKLLIDNRHEFILSFGDAPTEIIIDGMSSLVQLGAPSREIYIDNKYYSMNFGGLPIEVLICGRVRSICLPGPPPIVNFSPVKRIDLVAGTVSLYIDAKACICFFLDSTPQKFFIDSEPCVLQFADSLLTVLINGIPIPLEFGGSPVPVTVRGDVLHFLRLTCLPNGIIPGDIRIMNMICFAHPPPPLPPSIQLPPVVDSGPTIPMFQPPQRPPVNIIQQPVDLLTNIINVPTVKPTSEDCSYSVEKPPVSNVSEDSQTSTGDPSQNININDLFQKLIQIGLLDSAPKNPPVEKEKKKSVTLPEIEAEFGKPESLKCARPSLVAKLYSGIQCSSCGIRFPPEGTKMYSRHLDWHFRQNRREKHSTRKPQSRNWYYSYPNWLQYQELDDIDDNEPDHVEEEIEEDSEEDIPSVPVGRRKNVACQVCGETFEEFFDHETEEWQARNAILMEELFYHPLCYEEFKAKKDAGPEVEENMEEDLGPPLDDDPSTVEVIDLDDTEVPSPVSSKDDETLPLIGPEREESPDVIAVDDTSDEKSTNDTKPDETKEEASDDDDILDIIPIVRKIESYDLVDDDDDDKVESTEETINLDETKPDDTAESKEEEFDFTKVTIKKEKDRVTADNVDSSLPTYTATIDGNIVHESAVVPIVPTGRIKINIHRSKQTDDLEPSTDSNDGLALSQPLPPGEDVVLPQSVKPKLDGIVLSSQPPVNQGYELSGLCSIM